jgi:hypothetical protein
MAYKTDSQLKAQVDAVIVVNGNREITPPLDNSIRTNFIDSKLSLGGGFALLNLTGYTTELTPTDNKHLVPKKYVDDQLTSSLVWGNITGTLSDQTDLQTALDAKVNLLTGNVLFNFYDANSLGITTDNDGYEKGYLYLADNEMNVGFGSTRFLDMYSTATEFHNPTGVITVPEGSGTIALTSDVTLAIATAEAYADSLVVGLWDDRGSFDASVNAYPSSGGSGSAGAILKGDIWTISVAGTLPTSQVVNVGDTVRALTDTPGNTQANWAIAEGNLGYTPVTNARTLTINGTGYDLSADRTWTVGDALVANPLSQFASTTSLQLAGVISDETGSGSLVFATSPTLVTPVLGVATATTINKLTITAPATGSTLTIQDGFTLTANGNATVSGTNTGDQTITLTGDVTGSGTGSFATTIGAGKVTNSMLAGSIDLTSKVTGILPGTNGGTGVNNGSFLLTVPATGTAALLGTANVFTADQSLTANIIPTATNTYSLGANTSTGDWSRLYSRLTQPAAVTTTNTGGTSLGINSGLGNGSGAASSITFGTPTVLGAGAGAQSLTTRLTINSTALTSTVPFYAPSGSQVAPGYAFSGSTSTGLFLNTNNVWMSVVNTNIMNWSTTAVTSVVNILPNADNSYKLGDEATSSWSQTSCRVYTSASTVLIRTRDFSDGTTSPTTTIRSGTTGTGTSGAVTLTTGNASLSNGSSGNLVLSTGTITGGTGVRGSIVIGNATTIPIGFWNATPITQPANTVAINDVLVNTGLRASGGVSNFSTPVGFPSYTVGTLPSAATAGQMIFVSDESGGAVMAFSDGTNWRRVTDRAIVS